MNTTPSDSTILQMRGITKTFPGVIALKEVTFEVHQAQIHAIVGENGAGKSTLMKILSGVYPFGSYQGDILINGAVQRFHSIKESERAGVAIIYQELTLVKEMTICENIFLGSEIARGGVINWVQSLNETKRILKEIGLDIEPLVRVANLGIGQQQLVEIAKALYKNTKILLLDEPTAALSNEETGMLLSLIKKLKTKGVSCIYISHRLNEVFEIADRITVLRDGQTIHTDVTSNFTQETLISKMVGREITQLFPKKKRAAGKVVMQVKDWTVLNNETSDIALNNINFQVSQSEIVGIAGLVGAGRTELMMSLFGVWGKRVSGQIFLHGKEVVIRNPQDAITKGISLLSEDRKRYGLVLDMNITKNTTLANCLKVSDYGFIINHNKELNRSKEFVTELKIKTPSVEQKVKNLSGGNQQKVVIAKWLLTEPKVLILDEPTRGIDVGSKTEIYEIMNRLVDQGVCVIMISSELPEVLGMSDRILVMHEGVFTAELVADQATQEKIMYFATGQRQ
ncbi:MAG: xylose ABC transporter ATP-binding protein [Chitinivibrionales bacterium]|nr:xylose ABC transporter ATP-binding protein [Chitinivibrionales bacterium]